MRRSGAAFLIAAVITLVCSCTKPDTITNTVIRYVNKTDSINIRDSIYVHDTDTLIIAGDTIRQIQWRWRTAEHEIYTEKTDTIHFTDTIYVAKEKTLTAYQRFCINNFPAAVIILIAAIIIAVIIKRNANKS